MNITIIGNGNVGSTLGIKLANANHNITFGVRNINDIKNKIDHENISYLNVEQSIDINEIILICLPATSSLDFVNSNPNINNKIILDTTNSVFRKPEPYNNAFEVFQKLTNSKVAKVFNSTGVENMNNPTYHDQSKNEVKADMLVAGSDKEATSIALKLAEDVGFNPVYFGGDDKVSLLEDLCKIWISYSIQKGNRNFAFKILER